jgi:hypothetical protein
VSRHCDQQQPGRRWAAFSDITKNVQDFARSTKDLASDVLDELSESVDQNVQQLSEAMDQNVKMHFPQKEEQPRKAPKLSLRLLEYQSPWWLRKKPVKMEVKVAGKSRAVDVKCPRWGWKNCQIVGSESSSPVVDAPSDGTPVKVKVSAGGHRVLEQKFAVPEFNGQIGCTAPMWVKGVGKLKVQWCSAA